MPAQAACCELDSIVLASVSLDEVDCFQEDFLAFGSATFFAFFGFGGVDNFLETIDSDTT